MYVVLLVYSAFLAEVGLELLFMQGSISYGCNHAKMDARADDNGF